MARIILTNWRKITHKGYQIWTSVIGYVWRRHIVPKKEQMSLLPVWNLFFIFILFSVLAFIDRWTEVCKVKIAKIFSVTDIHLYTALGDWDKYGLPFHSIPHLARPCAALDLALQILNVCLQWRFLHQEYQWNGKLEQNSFLLLISTYFYDGGVPPPPKKKKKLHNHQFFMLKFLSARTKIEYECEIFIFMYTLSFCSKSN